MARGNPSHLRLREAEFYTFQQRRNMCWVPLGHSSPVSTTAYVATPHPRAENLNHSSTRTRNLVRRMTRDSSGIPRRPSRRPAARRAPTPIVDTFLKRQNGEGATAERARVCRPRLQTRTIPAHLNRVEPAEPHYGG